MAGFQVLDTPGHSAGHVSFWRESDRVLILGDVLNNMDVITGIPGLREPKTYFTPDPVENRRSIRRLGELEPSLVLFGHGAPLRDTRKFVDFVTLAARPDVRRADRHRAGGRVARADVGAALRHRRYAEWVEDTDKVTRTDGPAKLFSTYDEVNPILGPIKGRSHWVVTEFDPPRRQVHRDERLRTFKWLEVVMDADPGRRRRRVHPHPARRDRDGPARADHLEGAGGLAEGEPPPHRGELRGAGRARDAALALAAARVRDRLQLLDVARDPSRGRPCASWRSGRRRGRSAPQSPPSSRAAPVRVDPRTGGAPDGERSRSSFPSRVASVRISVCARVRASGTKGTSSAMP